MAATTTPRPKISTPRTGTRAYDAFVSYSHAADGRLAPAFSEVFSRLPSPGTGGGRCACSATRPASRPHPSCGRRSRRRSLRLATRAPGLPEAAASRWVDQEVRWWRENRSHDTVLIVLTDGELDWDDERGDFNAEAPIPPGLRDWFPHEPLWVDLRWARNESHVSMRNPRFRDCVGELAAPMHDLPKDELIGEDISQHRRTLRLARGGGGSPRAAVGAGRGRRDRGATSAK